MRFSIDYYPFWDRVKEIGEMKNAAKVPNDFA